MKNNNILTVCSYCGNIKVSDTLNIWISRRNNPKVFGSFLKNSFLPHNFLFGYSPFKSYPKTISHGMCPPCYEKEMKKLDDLDNQ